MKTFNLSIQVTSNTRVTPRAVAAAVRRLIDVGLNDARETIESGEGDLQAAELATDLNIGVPTIVSVPQA